MTYAGSVDKYYDAAVYAAEIVPAPAGLMAVVGGWKCVPVLELERLTIVELDGLSEKERSAYIKDAGKIYDRPFDGSTPLIVYKPLVNGDFGPVGDGHLHLVEHCERPYSSKVCGAVVTAKREHEARR